MTDAGTKPMAADVLCMRPSRKKRPPTHTLPTIIATSVVGITLSAESGSSSSMYVWMARPHSCTEMIGMRSGPEMIALQPEPRAKARQPTPMPSMTMPTPSATPNAVVDVSSVKMTALKTMQKNKYRMKQTAPAAMLVSVVVSPWCSWWATTAACTSVLETLLERRASDKAASFPDGLSEGGVADGVVSSTAAANVAFFFCSFRLACTSMTAALSRLDAGPADAAILFSGSSGSPRLAPTRAPSSKVMEPRALTLSVCTTTSIALDVVAGMSGSSVSGCSHNELPC